MLEIDGGLVLYCWNLEKPVGKLLEFLFLSLVFPGVV